MSLLPETKDIQSKLASYCRTGNEVELPGLTENRIHHYRRLVFGVVQEHLESSFPLAFECIDSEVWEKLLIDFFSAHKCENYQIWKIAGEFYKYCLTKNIAETHQLPFLSDLLLFEWEELRLYNMEDIPYPDFKEEGSNLDDPLICNPEYVLLSLEFPIHTDSPKQSLAKKGNYFVLLFREKETGKIQFMDLSVWFALIIEQITTTSITIKELINIAPQLFGDVELGTLQDSTLKFITELKNKGFVLGYRN